MEQLNKESHPKVSYIENIKKNFPQLEEQINRFNSKKEKLYYQTEKWEVNYEIIIEFCKDLANKYNKSECLKYLAYHLAIGSTPKKEEIQYFDFPGEDSIENFLDKLLKEQKQEQEYRQKENLDTKSEASNKD